MSVATITCAHILGLEAKKVCVEVDVGRGLYSFSIIGLPDKALDESKDRVIAALKNSGAKTPKTENHKVVVSLTPANVRKEGSHFDVPIALGYLLASHQIKTISNTFWFVGELSLKGDILPMKGVLLIAALAKKLGAQALFVPQANQEEASLIKGLTIYGCTTLTEIINHCNDTTGRGALIPYASSYEKPASKREPPLLNFADIKGQEHVKRALQIAAVGGHNIALYGPPGTGKTMLAKAFTSILPPLTEEEAFEVTCIHSTLRETDSMLTEPQLRSPHHTSSHVSLVGGGATPRPGEITLAHKGVLFLDEFPEFDKRVIESLREPLEEGKISVSRAKGTMTFPASCLLIASMNPCPCGYLGSTHKACTCTRNDIARYAKKLSGPIMDRIDMWVPVLHIDYDTLTTSKSGEDTETIRTRVSKARLFSAKRFKEVGASHLMKNKDMHAKDIDTLITLDEKCQTLMKKLATSYKLSPRSYHRVLKLARTIADYRNDTAIKEVDILEAFQYRPKLYQDELA